MQNYYQISWQYKIQYLCLENYKVGVMQEQLLSCQNQAHIMTHFQPLLNLLSQEITII